MSKRHARRPRSLRGALALAACLAPLACASSGSSSEAAREARDADVYHNAQKEQTEQLEREVARLRADLRQAEEAMVAIESGLRRGQTRADAVSSLAEARILVERAVRIAPWRDHEVAEALEKIEEAERQLRAGHSGSAIFFASRAQRIARTLNEEARVVASNASTRFIRTRGANLRAGPSTDHRVIQTLDEATPVFTERSDGGWVLVRTPDGPVGWVHGSLLGPR